MTSSAATPTTRPTTAPAIVAPGTVSEELLELFGILVGVGELEKELGGD
jgi:hypothetical protein